MITDLAARFRALSDPTRLLLLGILLDQELTVGELAEVVAGAQPGVSRHLAALREASLVAARKQGTMTFYRAAMQEGLLEGSVREQLEESSREPAIQQRIERVLERRRARSRAFFEQKAAGWDQLRHELLNDTAALSALLALVPRGLSVVDIGTGTGGMLPQLAEFASRVVAIDQSAQMLKVARERARRLGLAHVEFHKAEAGKLPLQSGQFDAAFASLVLHHVPRPADAVSEMARVIKPGGHVIIIDLCAHGQEWLRKEQADLWLGFSSGEVRAMLGRAHLSDAVFKTVSKVDSPRGGGVLELFVATATKRSK